MSGYCPDCGNTLCLCDQVEKTPAVSPPNDEKWWWTKDELDALIDDIFGNAPSHRTGKRKVRDAILERQQKQFTPAVSPVPPTAPNKIEEVISYLKAQIRYWEWVDDKHTKDCVSTLNWTIEMIETLQASWKNENREVAAPSVGELEWREISYEFESRDPESHYYETVDRQWAVTMYPDGEVSLLFDMSLELPTLDAAKSLANSLQRILSGAAE